MSYNTLISCADAASQLDNPHWRFIDCRFYLMQPQLGHEQYLADHITGALYAHLDNDLSSSITPDSGRHPLPNVESLVKKLSSWGIDKQTQVVVYDANIGMFASRLWWLLRWLGHGMVAVLDGGYQEWKNLALPTSTTITSCPATQFIPHLQENWIVSTDSIVQRHPHQLLLDARAAERYRGEVEPIDTIAGHIPGAINYPLTENMDETGKFKDAASIRQQVNACIGSYKETDVIHYCGSGVSACHNILAMEYAGLHGSKLYPGSWSEWIRVPARGIATGDE